MNLETIADSTDNETGKPNHASKDFEHGLGSTPQTHPLDEVSIAKPSRLKWQPWHTEFLISNRPTWCSSHSQRMNQPAIGKPWHLTMHISGRSHVKMNMKPYRVTIPRTSSSGHQTQTSSAVAIWTFRVKHDNLGEINKYKARLIAQGFSQIAGLDYNRIYSPMIRFTSICLILALMWN